MLSCSLFFYDTFVLHLYLKKNIDQRKQKKNLPECDDDGGEEGAEVIDAGEAKVGKLDARRRVLLYF